MSAIISYGHVAQETLAKLDRAVRSRIEDGWQPYGTMQLVDSQDGYRFIQMMVIYADAPDDLEATQATAAARRHLDMSTPGADSE